MSKFNHYLQKETDEKYYHMNSLSYYYDKMKENLNRIKELSNKIDMYDEELEAKIEEIDRDFDRLNRLVLNGEVDKSVLRTEIDQKLLQLEQDYAPKLNQISQELNLTMSDRNMVDFLNSISNRGESIYFKKKSSPYDFEILIPTRKGKGTNIEVIPDRDGFSRIRRAWNGSFFNEEGLDGRGVNYQSTTGAGWVKSSTSPSHYTTNVGNTFTLEFEGTGFQFVHRSDNTGGVWEFAVDGDVVKTVSTYATTDNSITITDVVSGLENTTHTVVATFKGDDPNNPPSTGEGTSRGWVWFDYNGNQPYQTIMTRSILQNHDRATQILEGDSVKEFAWSVKTEGATYSTQFVPSHGGLENSILISRKLFVDDKEVTTWENTGFIESSEVILSQSFYGKNTNSTANLFRYDINTIFNTSGITVIIKFQVLENMSVNPSYNTMLPVVTAFPKLLITNNDKTYGATLTSGDTVLDNPARSVAFVGGNHAVAISYENFIESVQFNRTDMPYKYFLQHRENLQKYYARIFYSEVIPAGKVFKSHARIAFAEMENLEVLIA